MGPGPRRGRVLTVALIGGGAAGPFLAGAIHDRTGSYRLAFFLAVGCCVVSATAVWMAAPGKVRRVPGRLPSHGKRAEQRLS